MIDFLEETARENNLEFFINDRNDLEIKDHNLVFNLADLLSGEKDSSKRWETYHKENKRCVFVYPPYLENENKRNVYKNILQETLFVRFIGRLKRKNFLKKII